MLTFDLTFQHICNSKLYSSQSYKRLCKLMGMKFENTLEGFPPLKMR